MCVPFLALNDGVSYYRLVALRLQTKAVGINCLEASGTVDDVPLVNFHLQDMMDLAEDTEA